MTHKLSEAERLERRKAIVLALFFKSGWKRAGEVAELINKNAGGIGYTMRIMASNGYLEYRQVIAKHGKQIRRQREYRLTAKGRRWAQKLTRCEPIKGDANAEEGAD